MLHLQIFFTCFNVFHSTGIFSRQQIDNTFYYLHKIGFDVLYVYVSSGDNLHEMSDPVFWGKYFKMLSAENFIQSAKQ